MKRGKLIHKLLGAALTALFLFSPAGAEEAEQDLDGELAKENPRDAADAGDLIRIPYRILQEDLEFLKGEQFKASVRPLRFIAVPWNLRSLSAEKRLLIGRTMDRQALYVFIPAAMTKRINTLVRAGKSLSFVYTPVALHARKYPVVELLSEIGAPPPKEKAAPPAAGELRKYFPAEGGMRWTVVMGDNLGFIEYQIQEAKGNEAKGNLRSASMTGQFPENTSDFRVVYRGNEIITYQEGKNAAGAGYRIAETVLKGPLKAGTRWTYVKNGMEMVREIVAVKVAVTIGSRSFDEVIVVKETKKEDPAKPVYPADVTYHFYAKGTGFLGSKIDSSYEKEKLRNYDDIPEWFIYRSE